MMTNNFKLEVKPFVIQAGKELAKKPLEEAAEVFGAWQNFDKKSKALKESLEPNSGVTDEYMKYMHEIQYECVDTIQAACNVLAWLGTSQDELDKTYDEVYENNKKRGRYK